ncbi:BREX-3 system phosphatase PglZ [Bacillus toyonensis]|uniref:BREX-3 system phosphatase PglZ n=1 Tax=Bacillus toyonensis TaxID=155322 RepID=UPI000BEBDECF|nr:BREX-3 system phosphatase PglZ [Bacillus toyonensis]MBJ8118464.1 BREX-3 system phosphatase PglZ [Bacillus cereus]PEB29154.1 hypothetical protein COO14_16595 [Bacillus toyonensis]HDR7918702.1 BREX-3 system phosphatase PglZ [Bacillus toyonensis]
MNWADKLATHFIRKGALYIVSDEYGLFKYQAVQHVIVQNGAMIHTYQDPVVFRLQYETAFRHEKRENRPTWIVTIETNQFNQLPFDILADANRMSVSWENIFSSLDPTVIQYCPEETLQLLLDASSTQFKPLNYNESIDFILTAVYQLDAALFSHEITIVKAAIRYYEQFSEGLPSLFFHRLKQNIQKVDPFTSTDLLSIFESKGTLTHLLNKQWQHYIQNFLKKCYEQIAETSSNYGFSYFDDPMIRQRLAHFITPIKVPNHVQFDEWMEPGLVREVSPSIDVEVLFNQDFIKFSRQEWSNLASKIGQMQYNYLNNGELPNNWDIQMQKINHHFENWMLHEYTNLRTLPVVPKPKMVHQIPHYLARKIDSKVALIVMDGMNFTQWHIIKHHLANNAWSFEEDAVFAWVPSVTSVSRQAIFSGLEPRQFADTIQSTRKEKTYWFNFWEQVGFTKQNIAYEKSLGLKAYNQSTLAYMQFPSVRIYGAVVDVIDQFMHGATQGQQTMFSELSTWLSTNYLNQLLTDLVHQGFDVYLTADHGNVECYGMGRIQEGVTVDSKGGRARIYQSKNIRDQTHLDHSFTTIPWNHLGLPNDYHVLLAKNNRAFVSKDDKIVTHGGIHLEEVIVPFVKVNC